MFFKSKDKPKSDSRIILGMILLEDTSPLNLEAFLADLKKIGKYKVRNPTGDASAAALDLGGETVGIATMPAPIPIGDLERAAAYAYHWDTSLEEVKDHKGHLLVSIMQGSDNAVKRFRSFTTVICSLLRTTKAIGVYMGSQSLLIRKDDYLMQAAGMSDDWYPLDLWIYFGLRVDGDNRSGYTYGLKEFNKRELEIVGSTRSLADIRAFLYNMTHYVLDYDVEFRDGQTCGLSATEKIAITLSPGVSVDGETFKLAY